MMFGHRRRAVRAGHLAFGGAARVRAHGGGRAFGMKVRRYFVGFGPTLWSTRGPKAGDTEYGVKAVPLGGFCDIAGMTSVDEVTPDEAPRAMWRFKTWKRTVVLAAGLVHALRVRLHRALPHGGHDGHCRTSPPSRSSTRSPTVSRSATTAEEWNDPTCRPGDPAPAKSAGLRPGDEVTAIDGTPVETWPELLSAVQSSSGPTRVPHPAGR